MAVQEEDELPKIRTGIPGNMSRSSSFDGNSTAAAGPPHLSRTSGGVIASSPSASSRWQKHRKPPTSALRSQTDTEQSEIQPEIAPAGYDLRLKIASNSAVIPKVDPGADTPRSSVCSTPKKSVTWVDRVAPSPAGRAPLRGPPARPPIKVVMDYNSHQRKSQKRGVRRSRHSAVPWRRLISSSHHRRSTRNTSHVVSLCDSDLVRLSAVQSDLMKQMQAAEAGALSDSDSSIHSLHTESPRNLCVNQHTTHAVSRISVETGMATRQTHAHASFTATAHEAAESFFSASRSWAMTASSSVHRLSSSTEAPSWLESCSGVPPSTLQNLDFDGYQTNPDRSSLTSNILRHVAGRKAWLASQMKAVRRCEDLMDRLQTEAEAQVEDLENSEPVDAQWLQRLRAQSNATAVKDDLFKLQAELPVFKQMADSWTALVEMWQVLHDAEQGLEEAWAADLSRLQHRLKTSSHLLVNGSLSTMDSNLLTELQQHSPRLQGPTPETLALLAPALNSASNSPTSQTSTPQQSAGAAPAPAWDAVDLRDPCPASTRNVPALLDSNSTSTPSQSAEAASQPNSAGAVDNVDVSAAVPVDSSLAVGLRQQELMPSSPPSQMESSPDSSQCSSPSSSSSFPSSAPSGSRSSTSDDSSQPMRSPPSSSVPSQVGGSSDTSPLSVIAEGSQPFAPAAAPNSNSVVAAAATAAAAYLQRPSSVWQMENRNARVFDDDTLAFEPVGQDMKFAEAGRLAAAGAKGQEAGEPESVDAVKLQAGDDEQLHNFEERSFLPAVEMCAGVYKAEVMIEGTTGLVVTDAEAVQLRGVVAGSTEEEEDISNEASASLVKEDGTRLLSVTLPSDVDAIEDVPEAQNMDEEVVVPVKEANAAAALRASPAVVGAAAVEVHEDDVVFPDAVKDDTGIAVAALAEAEGRAEVHKEEDIVLPVVTKDGSIEIMLAVPAAAEVQAVQAVHAVQGVQAVHEEEPDRFVPVVFKDDAAAPAAPAVPAAMEAHKAEEEDEIQGFVPVAMNIAGPAAPMLAVPAAMEAHKAEEEDEIQGFVPVAMNIAGPAAPMPAVPAAVEAQTPDAVVHVLESEPSLKIIQHEDSETHETHETHEPHAIMDSQPAVLDTNFSIAQNPLSGDSDSPASVNTARHGEEPWLVQPTQKELSMASTPNAELCETCSSAPFSPLQAWDPFNCLLQSYSDFDHLEQSEHSRNESVLFDTGTVDQPSTEHTIITTPWEPTLTPSPYGGTPLESIPTDTTLQPVVDVPRAAMDRIMASHGIMLTRTVESASMVSGSPAGSHHTGLDSDDEDAAQRAACVAKSFSPNSQYESLSSTPTSPFKTETPSGATPTAQVAASASDQEQPAAAEPKPVATQPDANIIVSPHQELAGSRNAWDIHEDQAASSDSSAASDEVSDGTLSSDAVAWREDGKGLECGAQVGGPQADAVARVHSLDMRHLERQPSVVAPITPSPKARLAVVVAETEAHPNVPAILASTVLPNVLSPSSTTPAVHDEKPWNVEPSCTVPTSCHAQEDAAYVRSVLPCSDTTGSDGAGQVEDFASSDGEAHGSHTSADCAVVVHVASQSDASPLGPSRLPKDSPAAVDFSTTGLQNMVLMQDVSCDAWLEKVAAVQLPAAHHATSTGQDSIYMFDLPGSPDAPASPRNYPDASQQSSVQLPASPVAVSSPQAVVPLLALPLPCATPPSPQDELQPSMQRPVSASSNASSQRVLEELQLPATSDWVLPARSALHLTHPPQFRYGPSSPRSRNEEGQQHVRKTPETLPSAQMAADPFHLLAAGQMSRLADTADDVKVPVVPEAADVSTPTSVSQGSTSEGDEPSQPAERSLGKAVYAAMMKAMAPTSASVLSPGRASHGHDGEPVLVPADSPSGDQGDGPFSSALMMSMASSSSGSYTQLRKGTNLAVSEESSDDSGSSQCPTQANTGEEVTSPGERVRGEERGVAYRQIGLTAVHHTFETSSQAAAREAPTNGAAVETAAGTARGADVSAPMAASGAVVAEPATVDAVAEFQESQVESQLVEVPVTEAKVMLFLSPAASAAVGSAHVSGARSSSPPTEVSDCTQPGSSATAQTQLQEDLSVKAVSSPVLAISSPTLAVSSPVQDVSSPMLAVSSPVKAVSSPVKAVSSPVKAVSSPAVRKPIGSTSLFAPLQPKPATPTHNSPTAQPTASPHTTRDLSTAALMASSSSPMFTQQSLHSPGQPDTAPNALTRSYQHLDLPNTTTPLPRQGSADSGHADLLHDLLASPTSSCGSSRKRGPSSSLFSPTATASGDEALLADHNMHISPAKSFPAASPATRRILRASKHRNSSNGITADTNSVLQRISALADARAAAKASPTGQHVHELDRLLSSVELMEAEVSSNASQGSGRSKASTPAGSTGRSSKGKHRTPLLCLPQGAVSAASCCSPICSPIKSPTKKSSPTGAGSSPTAPHNNSTDVVSVRVCFSLTDSLYSTSGEERPHQTMTRSRTISSQRESKHITIVPDSAVHRSSSFASSSFTHSSGTIPAGTVPAPVGSLYGQRVGGRPWEAEHGQREPAVHSSWDSFSAKDVQLRSSGDWRLTMDSAEPPSCKSASTRSPVTQSGRGMTDDLPSSYNRDPHTLTTGDKLSYFPPSQPAPTLSTSSSLSRLRNAGAAATGVTASRRGIQPHLHSSGSTSVTGVTANAGTRSSTMAAIYSCLPVGSSCGAVMDDPDEVHEDTSYPTPVMSPAHPTYPAVAAFMGDYSASPSWGSRSPNLGAGQGGARKVVSFAEPGTPTWESGSDADTPSRRVQRSMSSSSSLSMSWNYQGSGAPTRTLSMQRSVTRTASLDQGTPTGLRSGSSSSSSSAVVMTRKPEQGGPRMGERSGWHAAGNRSGQQAYHHQYSNSQVAVLLNRLMDSQQ